MRWLADWWMTWGLRSRHPMAVSYKTANSLPADDIACGVRRAAGLVSSMSGSEQLHARRSVPVVSVSDNSALPDLPRQNSKGDEIHIGAGRERLERYRTLEACNRTIQKSVG